jgi:hypothetical protein
MRSTPSSPIKPYGRDWNSDRSAPDYDPQRDPWNPMSPVFGQWPRRSLMRDMLKEPLVLAFAGWFCVTVALVALDHLQLISKDTFLVGWIGRYVFLFAGIIVAGIWSLVVWFRSTPRAERGPAFRQWLKRVPSLLAWLVGGTAVCVGLDWLEKRHGVPFLVSAGVLVILFFAVTWWWNRVRKAAAPDEVAVKESPAAAEKPREGDRVEVVAPKPKWLN